ncbi:MAG: hypothetical protein MRJ93_02990 [Nitrososphaeraceae archaeon]|nr:hypothetical protein [Nitrososphaeraceae archaeon]
MSSTSNGFNKATAFKDKSFNVDSLNHNRCDTVNYPIANLISYAYSIQMTILKIQSRKNRPRQK